MPNNLICIGVLMNIEGTALRTPARYMIFSRALLMPGDLSDPGMEPRPPALLADTLLSEPPGNCASVHLASVCMCVCLHNGQRGLLQD